MPIITKFKDILAWQKAHAFTLKIYSITYKFPKEEIFCLTSQIRRAAISISANIVEGFYRRTTKESLRFYEISMSSLEEVKYYILLSYDLKYTTLKEKDELNILADEVGKVLYGWMKHQTS